MPDAPARYRSYDEDSGRWLSFPFREGDIVISTRSKSGTTWLQMITALLVFQTPTLPAPLRQLSPWLDWLVTPLPTVLARLGDQQHRRFIKTHTPLDGVVLDDRATYIVVCRHPLDMAVSLYHQGDNLDRTRMAELIGGPAPSPRTAERRPLRDWLLDWIDNDAAPADEMDSFRGVLWHLSDAWSRRSARNVVLVHYDNLRADLDGEMRRIAGRLDITVPAEIWPELVRAATFDSMRTAATVVAPGPAGILKDPHAFFRRGTSGAGRELLTPAEYGHFRARCAATLDPEPLTWLLRDS